MADHTTQTVDESGEDHCPGGVSVPQHLRPSASKVKHCTTLGRDTPSITITRQSHDYLIRYLNA